MRLPKFSLVIGAGVVSAGLFYFGTGLHPTWWLLWLAPIPVHSDCAATSHQRCVSTRLNRVVPRRNEPMELSQACNRAAVAHRHSFFVIAAAVFGLGVLFTRSFLRRGSLFLAAFAFPVYWVTCEYHQRGDIASQHMGQSRLHTNGFSAGDPDRFGHWPLGNQLRCVFVRCYSCGTLQRRRPTPAAPRDWQSSVGLVISAVLLFGEWRLQSNSPAKSVSVTLIAKDVPMSLYLGSEQQAIELFREYADEIRRATTAGTQAVVLPEKIGRVSESALAQVDALFSSAATATRAAVVVGLVRRTSSGSFNSSRFYSADGKFGNYDKHHLIPRVEPEKTGDKRIILDQPSGKWGLQICKDMDFPALSREYAADGADLMLVPAWDFNVDGRLHSRMAVLRGVENGFALARSARNGLLTISDNRGRIPAETATAPGRFVSISGILNVAPEKTFYTRTGDWFAWLCVAAFVVLLASRLLMRPPIA